MDVPTEQPSSTIEPASEVREQALIEAMDTYGSYILAYLQAISSDSFLAEDLSQQLWIHVYERFPLTDFKKRGFLKRKAYQLFVDECRKRNVRNFVSYTDTPPESSPSPDLRGKRDEPEEPVLYERFWEQFGELELPENHKQIFWLHHRYGYTMKEISQILGIAASTAHDWLKLVKSQCLEYLNQQDHA